MSKYKAPYRLLKPAKKGGIIYYRLGSDVTRSRHSTGCRTEKEARQYCLDLIASKDKKTKEVLFEDYTKDFFVVGKCSFLQAKIDEDIPVSQKLTSDYQGYLKYYLLPYFGKYLLTEINPVEIRKWRTLLKQGKLLPPHLDHAPANATLNHIRNIFGVIMKQAEEENLIPSNPIPKVKPLSKQVYKKRDILTKEEIERLFPEDEKELLKLWGTIEKVSMLFLVLTSGMRSGELRALKWGDIDWKGKGVRITKAINADKKLACTKGKKPRGTIAPARAFILLKQWQELSTNKNPDSLVYLGQDGISPISPNNLRYALNKALKLAKINLDGRKNLVVHSLRHTYSSTMYYVLSPEALRGTIGHESEEMSERYTHLTPDEAIREYGTRYRKAIEKSW